MVCLCEMSLVGLSTRAQYSDVRLHDSHISKLIDNLVMIIHCVTL